MGGFRPLEILVLTLAAPATLFVLLWVWALPRNQGPLKPPAKKAAGAFHSRTRPVYVFQGELPGHRKVRVFRGLTPGLGGTGAARRALRLLGEGKSGSLLTLLLWNGSKAEIPPLEGRWSLHQGKDREWVLVSSLHPETALGRLLAGLYRRGKAPIPPGKAARFLFLSSRPLSPPQGKTLLLRGPQGQVSLSPRALPAQDVFQAWETRRKG